LVEVLDRVTMQLFVRGNCTMIAAPVQCDVDGIPKGSHSGRVPPMGHRSHHGNSTSRPSIIRGADRFKRANCPSPLPAVCPASTRPPLFRNKHAAMECRPSEPCDAQPAVCEVWTCPQRADSSDVGVSLRGGSPDGEAAEGNGARRRQRRSFTPEPTPPTIPDRVHGQFTAAAPDVLWVGDITYGGRLLGIVDPSSLERDLVSRKPGQLQVNSLRNRGLPRDQVHATLRSIQRAATSAKHHMR